MKAPRKGWWWIALAAGLLVLVGLFINYSDGQTGLLPGSRFDGARSFQHLADLCALGPRPSGSPGMLAQQTYLVEHFTKFGGQVRFQRWDQRHPEDGSPVPMANLVVEFHPERRERILLCAHYDTRPFPDRDPRNPRGVFVGANDGASGVAVLCELARAMPGLPGPCGVDFVLFDGEEFIFDDRRDQELYFLGATQFATAYAQQPPPHRYRWGVLLDMVGDADLQLFQERNSLRYARPLVTDIWRVAGQLGYTEFKPRVRHEVRDDHLPLNEIAGIPTCDIIDFDYPRPGLGPSYWHTEADAPDKCSPESLAIVGRTLHVWLQRETARTR